MLQPKNPGCKPKVKARHPFHRAPNTTWFSCIHLTSFNVFLTEPKMEWYTIYFWRWSKTELQVPTEWCRMQCVVNIPIYSPFLTYLSLYYSSDIFLLTIFFVLTICLDYIYFRNHSPLSPFTSNTFLHWIHFLNFLFSKGNIENMFQCIRNIPYLASHI